jgi:integrase
VYLLVSVRFAPYIGHTLDTGEIMARTIRDNQLGTRTARQGLKIRSKPYYRGITEGLHLGYRRLRGADGSWIARIYVGGQQYVTEKIGIADDLNDADGVAVLTFTQAADKARELHTARARQDAGLHGSVTVNDAIAAYVVHLDQNGKKTDGVERGAKKYIAPLIGALELAELTSETLNKWKADIAAMPARGRAFDAVARKASANRTMTSLRAALKLAYENGKVSSDAAWRRLKMFKNANRNREQFLSVAEAQRLINVCDPDFRQMVQAALQTGCRYEELCNLKVSDFDADSATISIQKSKSGRGRKVFLTDEGVELFASLAAGRKRTEPLIRRDDGLPFGTSQQIRRMRLTCERAGIDPIPFHCLRHSYASALVKAGVPLLYVAQSLGHTSIKMVQEHYGHLEKSHLAETIRASVPSYGLGKKSNVTAIR